MDEEVVPEFLELLRTSFPDTPFKTTRALPYIIEIVAEGVDKSGALAYFCGKYDIKPENVITFVRFLLLCISSDQSLTFPSCTEQGDGENDVGMFNAAGYSVSMGNAMDAPRNAASYSTGTNNEGGVGQFLDRVFRVSFHLVLRAPTILMLTFMASPANKARCFPASRPHQVA